MLDVSALKQFHPLIATPCYGDAVFHNYVISLVNFIRVSAESGMPVSVHMRAGDSLVTRARNDCVAEFLSNEVYSHLFWIDGDIGFSPEAALRLLLADHDVAAGVYPLKRLDWPKEGVPANVTSREEFEQLCARYTANAADQPGPEIEVPIDDDGFIKVLDAPTGFMVIKRDVFQKLIENYPDYKYVPDWPEGTYPEGGVHYSFFDTIIDPDSRRYLSEDYAFCRLLQNLGVDIYADANSNLTHLGQHLYAGSFGTALANTPAQAIGATKGKRLKIVGINKLTPNP
jgi:hypothetical protein